MGVKKIFAILLLLLTVKATTILSCSASSEAQNESEINGNMHKITKERPSGIRGNSIKYGGFAFIVASGIVGLSVLKSRKPSYYDNLIIGFRTYHTENSKTFSVKVSLIILPPSFNEKKSILRAIYSMIFFDATPNRVLPYFSLLYANGKIPKKIYSVCTNVKPKNNDIESQLISHTLNNISSVEKVTLDQKKIQLIRNNTKDTKPELHNFQECTIETIQGNAVKFLEQEAKKIKFSPGNKEDDKLIENNKLIVHYLDKTKGYSLKKSPKSVKLLKSFSRDKASEFGWKFGMINEDGTLDDSDVIWEGRLGSEGG
jgi:hypothetical protein